MEKEQILKEHKKLLFANIEAITAHIFYAGQYQKIMNEIKEMSKEGEKKDWQELSEEEKFKETITIRERLSRLQSAMELMDIICRQKDKAKRKYNESQKRLEAFCQRHGIENVASERPISNE